LAWELLRRIPRYRRQYRKLDLRGIAQLDHGGDGIAAHMAHP